MTSTSTRSAVTTGQRLEVFSVILLQHAGRWLLLQRAPTKRLFPSKWTGVGGQVEPREFDDLATSA
ncbi:MAG TPA: NUDIX domain-containing protein, partial [Deinococcales bacterium]|nr:NUDIX domain-containing protein [Deinococcales bacterium]